MNLNAVFCLTEDVIQHRLRLQQSNLTKSEYRKIDLNRSWTVKADSQVFLFCIGRAKIKPLRNLFDTIDQCEYIRIFVFKGIPTSQEEGAIPWLLEEKNNKKCVNLFYGTSTEFISSNHAVPLPQDKLRVSVLYLFHLLGIKFNVYAPGT